MKQWQTNKHYTSADKKNTESHHVFSYQPLGLQAMPSWVSSTVSSSATINNRKRIINCDLTNISRKNNLATQKNRDLSYKEEGVNTIESLFVKEKERIKINQTYE